LASPFSEFLLRALRQFLSSVFHMATMCISQLCLGSGVLYCSGKVLLHIGLVEWSVWSLRICTCAYKTSLALTFANCQPGTLAQTQFYTPFFHDWPAACTVPCGLPGHAQPIAQARRSLGPPQLFDRCKKGLVFGT